MSGRWWIVIGLAWAAACGPALPPAAPSTDPQLDAGPLRAVSTFSFDFQWRQRVTARWPDGTQGFDAVLMKRDGQLTLLGLSPMGVPGFVITLDANGQTHVDNRTGEPLPFPPSYVLADVQRVFFPWLGSVAEGFSGERTGTTSGLTVRERYEDGRLVERYFARDDAKERGEVRVYYEGFRPGDDVPLHAVLENRWFGYTLIIDTVEQTRL
jgi:hypothetical protein